MADDTDEAARHLFDAAQRRAKERAAAVRELRAEENEALTLLLNSAEWFDSIEEDRRDFERRMP